MSGSQETQQQLPQQTRIQCPYTASSCPLFNPSFSVADVLAAGPSSAAPSSSMMPPSPGKTLEVASPPLRLVDSMRNARALSPDYITNPTAGATAAYSYTDYPIAPSPELSNGGGSKTATTSAGSASPSSPKFAHAESRAFASPSSSTSALPLPPPGSAYSSLPFAGPSGIRLPSIGLGNAAHSLLETATLASGYQLSSSSSRPTHFPQQYTANGFGPSAAGSPPAFAPPRYSYERRRSGLDEEVIQSLQAQAQAQAASGGSSVSGAGLGLNFAPCGGGAAAGDTSAAYDLAALMSAGGSRRPSYASPYASSASVPTVGSALMGGTDGDFEVNGDEDDDGRDGDYVQGSAVGGTKRARQRPSAPTAVPLPLANGFLAQPSYSNGLPVPPSMAPTPSGSASPSPGVENTVTPFITKLHHVLNNPVHADVIRWNATGTSILYAHTSPRLLDILGKYFRHTSVTSLARQLNIYDFRRLTVGELLLELDASPGPNGGTGESASASEWSGFTHALFWRDEPGRGPCEMWRLKPQGPKTEKGKANLAKKMAEGGKKRKKAGGVGGGKAGGVRKGGME
ncbi:hypothetical protein JCM10449v2_006672 [Rhodotorula kratochvilovae]